MKTLLTWVRAIKGSVIGFGVTLVLGLVSMGLLGIGLYFAVVPVLAWRYLPETAWRGDWVWPAMIGTGMAWSVGFLLAGVADGWFVSRGWSGPRRGVGYLGILWLWALLVWAVTLEFAPQPGLHAP